MKKSIQYSLFLLFLLCWRIFPLAAQTNSDDYNILVSLDSINFPTVHLGEVVIKSARDHRPLQELPISTSLVPSAQVEQEQILGLTDLTTRVPNLYMPSYGSKLTSPIYIRGIGSRINSPAIGLYVDYIPQFDKSSFDFEFFDIERIEVLRGPQGTMYGRNNLGGLIHVFTQSPDPKKAPSVVAGASLGNYGARTYNLLLNKQMSPKSSLQVSGRMNHRDGYFKNQFSGQMADELDVYNGRLRLIHKWNKKISSDLIVTYENSEQGGYAYGLINPETDVLNPVNYNEPSSYLRDLASAGLVNSFNMGDLNLRSTTSAQYIDDNQTIDQDFTPEARYLVKQPQTQTIFSQELSGTLSKNNLELVAGVFGFVQNLDKDVRVEIGPSKSTISRKDYEHTNAGAAAFSQATLKNFVIKGLSLTAGLRLDYEEATQDYYYDRVKNDVVTPVDSTDSKLTFSELMPRLTLDYQLSRHLNGYLSLTKGYKTGGFNSTIERPEDQTFDAEQSWNYEAGLKSKWLFNMLRFSITGFYIDWKNQQVYQPVPSGQGSMLTNAGRSESRGLEAEVTFKPSSMLETTVNVGSTRAVFTQYQKNDSTNLDGNFLPYAPRTTLHIAQNIFIPVKKRWLNRVALNINYQGIDKLYWSDENTTSQSYYGLLNATATLSTKHVDLSFWAKNIFNTDFRVFQFTALGNNYAQQGIPAIFGTRLKMTF